MALLHVEIIDLDSFRANPSNVWVGSDKVTFVQLPHDSWDSINKIMLALVDFSNLIKRMVETFVGFLRKTSQGAIATHEWLKMTQ